MNNKVVAVVVTYNRKKLLKECIECLKGQTNPCDILIIDNASTDGTKDAIAYYIESGFVKYMNTGSNLGGAGGFQYGVKEAVRRGYDYIWLMDDDSMPSEDALACLINAGEKLGNYGFLASKVLWKDGSLCTMNRQRNLNMKVVNNFSESYIPVKTSTFVSFFLPSLIVIEIGLPIREFFIWADDFEYSTRISSNYPCYLVTDSIVVHKCSTNNGPNIATDTEERISRYRYAFRNEVYIRRRDGVKGWIHLMLRTPYQVAKVLLKAKNKKMERIKVILGSTLEGISFKPAIEYINGESE